MSLFAQILCEQFPNVQFPCINNLHIKYLNSSYYDSNLVHNIGLQLVYNIYYLNLNTDPKKIGSNKFTILNELILSNTNLNEQLINYYFINFCYSQKIYNIFRRFVLRVKLKYTKKFEISTDLCFNPFNSLKENMIISFIEKDTLYKFRISDIINIINKSLSNSLNFFADPLPIKNPYTNLPFCLSNLYNIYFRIKNSNYNMPILFHQFFISNFNLLNFQNNNECLIREKAINYFIKDATLDEKYEYINKMFYSHYEQVLFEIDPLFPKKNLVKTFDKYIYSFLLEEFSLNPYVRDTNRIKLNYNLILFSQLNPNFGKRIINRQQRRTMDNSHNLSFYQEVIESSHINLNYNSLITTPL